ncbi:g4920 [Coccomyxa elongata]
MRLIFLPDGVVTTHLYDKRRDPKFADIEMVRFPHISSNLSARCKYNCLTGEFHRLRRIVLQHDNFCMELASVQVELELRGYSPRRLRKQLQKLCFTHPDLYNRSPNFLLAQIDIYYRIHHRLGLHPYPLLQLPLLEEHIVPAAN